MSVSRKGKKTIDKTPKQSLDVQQGVKRLRAINTALKEGGTWQDRSPILDPENEQWSRLTRLVGFMIWWAWRSNEIEFEVVYDGGEQSVVVTPKQVLASEGGVMRLWKAHIIRFEEKLWTAKFEVAQAMLLQLEFAALEYVACSKDEVKAAISDDSEIQGFRLAMAESAKAQDKKVWIQALYDYLYKVEYLTYNNHGHS